MEWRLKIAGKIVDVSINLVRKFLDLNDEISCDFNFPKNFVSVSTISLSSGWFDDLQRNETRLQRKIFMKFLILGFQLRENVQTHEFK